MQHVCEAISSRIRDYMDPLPEVEMIPHDIDGLHILNSKSTQGIILHITMSEMVSVLPLFASVMKAYLPQQSRWFAWY